VRAQKGEDVKDLPSFVRWVNATHKAPFDRDAAVLPPGGAKALKEAQERQRASIATRQPPAYKNDKVSRDRNPWPKAEIGAAIDPTNGKRSVVMSNDFRLNYDHQFFHVTSDGGETWTDDAMVGGAHPSTGFLPGNYQSDPGVSFDRMGHSYLSTISGNLIIITDINNNYLNLDTEVEVAQGFAHGDYANLVPTAIDDQPCSGVLGSTFVCDSTLDKPLITTDVSGASSDGTTYVYYTFFCMSSTGCSDGSATNIPPRSSVILESHSPGADFPFSPPALVSGSLANAQFSDMVIDSDGTPHIFFDDFTDPAIKMWESTLQGSTWVVSRQPIVEFFFSFLGLNNPNWAFRDRGTVAPGCGRYGDTAYCAFSANQIVGRPDESTPSVYLATVHLETGKSTISRVNNDAFRGGKHHFFPWATATPNGDVYVGWYDDRSDPFNAKVEYFVAKSVDGGKTFPRQQAVSDTAFNPCIGFPGCSFFGDYTQLVSGPDGTVHAAWTDTRDDASQQIWAQELRW
jgi:hypothetical protein